MPCDKIELRNDNGKGGDQVKKIFSYVDSALDSLPDSKELYKFKKMLTDSLTDRANEITHSGLRDEKVLEDIILSEHPDVKGEFETYIREKEEKKAQKRAKTIKFALGALYTAAVIIVYFIISVLFKNWSRSWLIPECGVSLLIIGITVPFIKRFAFSVRPVFRTIARILVALDIMLVTTSVFLVCLVIVELRHTWRVYIIGAIILIITDAVLTTKINQNFAIFSFLFTIPVVTALVYVVIAVSGLIPWHPGWIMVPASLLIDIIVAAVKIVMSIVKGHGEEEVEWQES